MRAARPVTHGREGDLTARDGAVAAAAGDERAAGRPEGDERQRRGGRDRRAQHEGGGEATAAAAGTLGHGNAQRRRDGGLPLLGPERAQLRGHLAQLDRDVVVVACHAPSTSIISRSRVRPRTIRALTVPIGMPVAALISLWLSSS